MDGLVGRDEEGRCGVPLPAIASRESRTDYACLPTFRVANRILGADELGRGQPVAAGRLTLWLSTRRGQAVSPIILGWRAEVGMGVLLGVSIGYLGTDADTLC